MSANTIRHNSCPGSLQGNPLVSKRLVTAAGVLTLTTAALAGCGSSGSGNGQPTLGFSQVGAESGRRTANTRSIHESAKTAGINLKFADAQQKQENQIKRGPQGRAVGGRPVQGLE
ncbi:hypothetical protein [Nocardia sp. alder85J]|uniref:hypothetical protein n=1 Tax=Nocardia sp. alder85J TaxID=2862949 RepID=UPI002B1CD6F7|nr:hypothetical protein [Nocardia sp. alder85J]